MHISLFATAGARRSSMVAKAAAVLLASLLAVHARSAGAATSPNFDPACAPRGTATCASMVPDAWEYSNNRYCSTGGPYATEAAATDAIIDLHTNSCSVNLVATGSWLVSNQTTTISECGGSQVSYLSLPFLNRNTGLATRDFKPYRLTNVSSPPNCSSTTTTDFYVRRSRDLVCPASGMTVTYYGSFIVDGTSYSQKYCKGNNEAKELGSQCDMVGNPINVGTSNKYQLERDYAPATDSPLRWERHYNSAGHRHTTTYRFGDHWLSQLGPHWRHTYDRSIKLLESGSLITAFVYRPDGKIYWYNLYQDQWYSDRDISSRLERLASAGAYVGWRFTNAADDSVEIYDADGKLQSITSREGRSITLTYGADGLLATVSDHFGRQLQLAYAAGRLQTLTTPDGASYAYAYDANGLLAAVTYPDTTTRSYTYNEPAYIEAGASLPRALTGIFVDGQRFATFRYYGSGHAQSSEHGSGAELTTLSYPTATTRVVVDALGTSRTYGIATVAGARRVTSISQSCTGCGASAAITYAAAAISAASSRRSATRSGMSRPITPTTPTGSR